MTEKIAAFLTREEELRREPWRRHCEKVRDLMELGKAEGALGRQQRAAAELAKAGALSTTEAMGLAYSLFGNEGAREYYGELITTTRGRERLQLHNYFIAMAHGDAFLKQHGAALESLCVPLFPPHETFEGLNIRILLDHREAMSRGGGGDGNRTWEQKYYRAGEGGERRGAGYLPVEAGPNPDQYVVRVDPIEGAFTALQLRVAQLERRAGNGAVGQSTPSAGRPTRCYACGGAGHIARNCPGPKNGKTGPPPPPPQ